MNGLVILGGIGPEAAGYFMTTLARRTDAVSDQDHVPCLVLSLPHIADRSLAILAGSDTPREQIVDGLQRLQAMGCGAVAVPCNTAHFWHLHFKSAVDVPFIDMIAATGAELSARGVRTVAILGTISTVRMGIYSLEVECATGQPPIQLPEATLSLVERAIRWVKAGERRQASAAVTEAIQHVRSTRAEAVVLGCTELPIVVPDQVKGDDLIDPGELLADSCIGWWRTATACVAETQSVEGSALLHVRGSQLGSRPELGGAA